MKFVYVSLLIFSLNLAAQNNEGSVGELFHGKEESVYNSQGNVLTATDDQVYAAPADTVFIDVLKNDTQSQDSSFYIVSVISSATTGEVIFNEDEIFIRYIAREGDVSDSFDYIISDGAEQDTATVYIHVAKGLSADAWTLALYKFENDSANMVRDYSGNDLYANNKGTEAIDGPYGKAAYFNGSAAIEMDIIRQQLNGSTEWTLEYVARSIDSVRFPAFFNHSCGNGWVFYPSGSKVSFGIKTNTSGACYWHTGSWGQTESFTRDTLWHYFALTFKSGDSLRVYRDGLLIGGYGVDGVFTPTQGSSLKAYLGYDDYGRNYQTGYADEIRISRIARAPGQLKSTWNNLKGAITVTALDNEEGFYPGDFSLLQNYPNPFNPSTTIRYRLGQSSRIRLAVYDVSGREVKTLFNGRQSAGRHSLVFDAGHLASGIYIYKLQVITGGGTGPFELSRKMVLVR